MKSSIPFPPEPEGWNQRLLSHETKNTLSLIPHLSAIGPPITQPRRSPITNKLAEMRQNSISLFIIQKKFYQSMIPAPMLLIFQHVAAEVVEWVLLRSPWTDQHWDQEGWPLLLPGTEIYVYDNVNYYWTRQTITWEVPRNFWYGRWIEGIIIIFIFCNIFCKFLETLQNVERL